MPSHFQGSNVSSKRISAFSYVLHHISLKSVISWQVPLGKLNAHIAITGIAWAIDFKIFFPTNRKLFFIHPFNLSFIFSQQSLNQSFMSAPTIAGRPKNFSERACVSICNCRHKSVLDTTRVLVLKEALDFDKLSNCLKL